MHESAGAALGATALLAVSYGTPIFLAVVAVGVVVALSWSRAALVEARNTAERVRPLIEAQRTEVDELLEEADSLGRDDG